MFRFILTHTYILLVFLRFLENYLCILSHILEFYLLHIYIYEMMMIYRSVPSYIEHYDAVAIAVEIFMRWKLNKRTVAYFLNI